MKITLLAVVAMAASVMAAPIVEVRLTCLIRAEPASFEASKTDAYGHTSLHFLTHIGACCCAAGYRYRRYCPWGCLGRVSFRHTAGRC